MARRTSQCRELYLDILRLLIQLDLYAPPSEDVAAIALDRMAADGHQDGRRSGDTWPELRMRQILSELVDRGS